MILADAAAFVKSQNITPLDSPTEQALLLASEAVALKDYLGSLVAQLNEAELVNTDRNGQQQNAAALLTGYARR